jgi:serine/threonine protein kinase
VIGELVGAYRLTQKLGEGTTGETYLGVHKESAEQAAVKVLFPQLCADAALLDPFLADIKVASLVNHTGIADLFDCGILPNQRAFVIGEYLQGKTLTDALIELGQVTDVASLADIAWQTATMLGAAHEAGIVHGALKPDALFLTFPPGQAPRPLVKLVDFGMAQFKLGVRQSQTGSLLGAPLYMSPEASRGLGDVDRRADIYSLGCIMFEMICGRPPFVRAGAGELIIAHANESPPFASSLEPSVPQAIDQLIGRMLTKNPLTRPQTMAEVAALLERFFKCPTPLSEQPRSPTPMSPQPAPGASLAATPPAVTPASAGESGWPPAGPRVDATAVVPGTAPTPATPGWEARRSVDATAVLPGAEQAPRLSSTALLPSGHEGASSGPTALLPPQQSWLGKVRQWTVVPSSPPDVPEALPGVRPSASMREPSPRRSTGRRPSRRSASPGAGVGGVSQSINVPLMVISAAVLLVVAAVVLLVVRGRASPPEQPRRPAAKAELVAPVHTVQPAAVEPPPPSHDHPGMGSAVGTPPAGDPPEPPDESLTESDDDSAGARAHQGKDKGRPRRFW